jgi:hypothetical protein
LVLDYRLTIIEQRETEMYTEEQLEMIAYYHNWGGIQQDSDGNLSWNTHQDNETGWHHVTERQINEALAANLADGIPPSPYNVYLYK